MTHDKNVYFRWSLLWLTLLVGCASNTVEKAMTLAWPLPPEEPRILYLATYHGERDYKQSSAFLRFLIGNPAATINLTQPQAVAAYRNKIYVADTAQAMVFVFDPIEKKVSFLGQGQGGKLQTPLGIAIDNQENIWVSDGKQKKIFGYDSQGNLKMALGEADELVNPVGLAIDYNLHRLYVADSKLHAIHVYSLQDYKRLFKFGQKGKADGEFYYPTYLAVNPNNGNVYVSDSMNFRVQVFDKDGKFLSKFGRLGRNRGDFSRPKGVAVDSENHVYVVDAGFGNFQIFDDQARLLLFVGTNGNQTGEFSLPAGAYIDEQDRIYVADLWNRRVQVFQYLSEKWKKEHPEEYQRLKQTYGK